MAVSASTFLADDANKSMCTLPHWRPIQQQ